MENSTIFYVNNKIFHFISNCYMVFPLKMFIFLRLTVAKHLKIIRALSLT